MTSLVVILDFSKQYTPNFQQLSIAAPPPPHPPFHRNSHTALKGKCHGGFSPWFGQKITTISFTYSQNNTETPPEEKEQPIIERGTNRTKKR